MLLGPVRDGVPEYGLPGDNVMKCPPRAGSFLFPSDHRRKVQAHFHPTMAKNLSKGREVSASKVGVVWVSGPLFLLIRIWISFLALC